MLLSSNITTTDIALLGSHSDMQIHLTVNLLPDILITFAMEESDSDFDD